MEIRALINKISKTLETHDKDEKVTCVFNSYDMGKTTVTYGDFYFERPDTLDEFRVPDGIMQMNLTLAKVWNMLKTWRLENHTALQKHYDITKSKKYIEIMKRKKNVWKDYLKASEDLKKIMRKYTMDPNIVEEWMQRIGQKGKDVDMIECCDQDMRYFGADHGVSVLTEDVDGKAVYKDWMLDCQKSPVFPNGWIDELITKDSQYIETMDLQTLCDKLMNQEKGIYQKAEKRGVILQFPGVNKK